MALVISLSKTRAVYRLAVMAGGGVEARRKGKGFGVGGSFCHRTLSNQSEKLFLISHTQLYITIPSS